MPDSTVIKTPTTPSSVTPTPDVVKTETPAPVSTTKTENKKSFVGGLKNKWNAHVEKNKNKNFKLEAKPIDAISGNFFCFPK